MASHDELPFDGEDIPPMEEPPDLYPGEEPPEPSEAAPAPVPKVTKPKAKKAAAAPRKNTALASPAAKAAVESANELTGAVSTIDAVAEARVISAVFQSPELLDDAYEVLHSEDFGVPAHGIIWGAILSCDAQGRAFDPVTVADELTRSGLLHQIGGPSAIDTVVSAPPILEEFDTYVELIGDRALRRRLLGAAREIGSTVLSGTMDQVALTELAEQKIFAATSTRGVGSTLMMPQLVAQIHEEMAKSRSSKLLGQSFGFETLDRITGGAQEGQLIIVAARPAMGKSAFALQIARTMAETSDLVVPFLSYEMSASELGFRMLSAATGIDMGLLMRGQIPDGMEGLLAREAEKLAALRLIVDDRPPPSIAGVRSMMRKLARRGEIGAVVLDYLQLIKGDSRRGMENRTQEVSDISREAKLMAKELKVPVIALSQLNRGLESRPNKRPMLSDLRESGCLTAETRILRADTGSEITLGELIETGERNVPVWSTDEDNKLVVSTLTHAFPSGRKETYRVTTASGSVIKATGNHPFLTLNGWASLDDLEVGSRIGAPLMIPEPLNTVKVARDKLLVLAHMIGDGCVISRQPVHYTNADPENLDTVEQAAIRAFGVKTRRDVLEGHSQLFLSKQEAVVNGVLPKRTNPISDWFKELGVWNLRSHQKHFPEVIFSLSNDDLAFFLRHLWATDGSITVSKGNAHIYYSTNSRLLADQVKLALLRFRITARITTVRKAGYKDGYMVTISGAEEQLIFCKKIGSHGARGVTAEKLVKTLAKIKLRACSDYIPKEIWEDIRVAAGERGTTLIQLSQATNLSYVRTPARSYALSRTSALTLAEMLDLPELTALAESDIHWDKIVKIEPIGERDVYDATVLETHNFTANGLTLHNSLEQDSDSVLFLYRDSVYNPAAPEDEAEILLAKNRQGVSGVIVPTKWEGKAVRFRDTKADYTRGAAGGLSTAPKADGSWF